MAAQLYRLVAETTALERGKQRLKPLRMLIKDGEVSGHGARVCPAASEINVQPHFRRRDVLTIG